MNTSLTNWRIVGLLAAILVFASASAWAVEPVASDASQAPAAEPRFKPGDTLLVAAERANLMLGNDVIAAVRKGQRIVVVEVRHPWVGTYVMANNQKKVGWIRSKEFLPADIPALAASAESSAGPQVYSSYRPVAEPAAAPVRVYVAPSNTGVDDAYLVGKYQRHELDPNVHVWVPWRRR